MSQAVETAIPAPSYAPAPADAVATAPLTSAAAERLVFVDLARAIAVLFMIQGHSLHVLLAPEYSSGPIFDAWLFLRGLTSCTFLLLAGFSFSLATVRHWDVQTAPSPRLWRRLRRFAFFLALGYAMRFPTTTFAELTALSPERWRYFMTVDVLQCVAVSLVTLQLLAMLGRTPQRFVRLAMLLCAVVVLATPLSWAFDWSGAPVAVAAYLSASTGSLFPLLPWAAYPLLGAALGGMYAAAPVGAATFATRTLLPAAGAFIATGVLLHQLPRAGIVDYWPTSPNMFLIKAGCVLSILGAIAWGTRAVRRLPSVLQALSQESLVLYFAHVCILYGSIWSIGLRQAVGARLGPAQTLLWIAALLASMSLVAWVWNGCKRHRPSLASMTRLTVVGSLVWALW